MAEGGHLPWKIQTIDCHRGPAADYSSIYSSLPKPPSGFEWKQDGNKDWRVVKIVEECSSKATDAPNDGSEWQFVRIEQNIDGHGSIKTEEKEDDTLNEKQKEKDEETGRSIDDYVVHTVLPSDTLPGLCLRYRVTATKLRQVNRFSGSNLNLAPANLIIPVSPDAINIQVQDKNGKEYKLQAVLADCPWLCSSERRAYLEMNDWNLAAAIKNAQEDKLWEESQQNAKSVEQTKVKEDDKSNDYCSSELELSETRAPRIVHVAVPVDEKVALLSRFN